MTDRDPVIVARVVRAHGIRGGLLLEAETDHGEALFQPGRRLSVVGGVRAPGPTLEALTLVTSQLHQGRWLVATAEVADRTAAEAIRGARLAVARDELPDLDDDGYLLHDLIGMAVVDGDQPLGDVKEVYDQPGAPLLAVEVDGRERLIPFQADLVEAIDLEAGEIRVSLPAGLLDI